MARNRFHLVVRTKYSAKEEKKSLIGFFSIHRLEFSIVWLTYSQYIYLSPGAYRYIYEIDLTYGNRPSPDSSSTF